jgi:hypothetical protein
LPRETHFDEQLQDVAEHAPDQLVRRPWQTPAVIAASKASSAESIGGNPGDGLTNLC